jgi:hypothetical protein
MTPGLQLFLTFTLLDIVLGILATRLVARLAGGPRNLLANVVPILSGFGAMGILGHSMGAHIGPLVPLYGFDVALFGDMGIGFVFALLGALVQAAVLRAVRRRSSAA